MDFAIFKQLLVAVALSGLIGMERERTILLSFGGVRTFILIGLLGALSYILSSFSIVYFIVISLAFFALIISSYIVTTIKSEVAGATTELAAIIIYIVGVLCAMEHFVLATSISLFLFLLLHLKEPFHAWIKALSPIEINSAIKFILIAFVVLPLLPNQYYGPYNAFNPYIIWLMVVLISGISFLSYVAIKFFGEKKGIGVTGFLAGLISSTALVLSFAPMSKKNRTMVNPYVIAIVIASSAMFFRMMIEVLVLNPALLKDLWLPLSVMGGVGISIAGILFWRRTDESTKELEEKATDVESPFKLMPALKFGLFFGLILLLVGFAESTMGDRGLYFVSFLSGIVTVDAITVSVATLAREGGLETDIAVNAIVLGAVSNTVTKACLFALFGAFRATIKIVAIFGIMLLAGALVLFM